MAPQSPTSSLNRLFTRGFAASEPTQRAPMASSPHTYMGWQEPYQRYEGAYRYAYDIEQDSARRSQSRDRAGGDRTPWEVARERPAMVVRPFKRSASDMLEYESSPIATLRQLPTIDALCGVSTKKRLSVASAYTHATPPSNSSPSTRPTETRHPETTHRQQRRASVSADDKGNGEPIARTGPAPTPQAAKKRQRYLHDVDRRSIILRIENGEKQAALAREFGVTRAAICHIKKNRNEIVSRYDSLLQSAQEMERAGTIKASHGAPSTVHELARPSVLLLLTTLRDVATSRRAFRAAADRLMMVLLEEALATVATVACALRTTNGQTMRGVKPERRLCCLSVGHKGVPLVRLYHAIEPSGAVGCIQMLRESHEGGVVPVAGRVDLPREMTTPTSSPDAAVLLFTCSTATGQSVCAAIDALLAVGVAEENVRVVALACTSRAVAAIASQFPAVRILTCAVEIPAREPASALLSTTLSDFLERYSAVSEPPHAEDQRQPPRGHRQRPHVARVDSYEDMALHHHHTTRDVRGFHG